MHMRWPIPGLLALWGSSDFAWASQQQQPFSSIGNEPASGWRVSLSQDWDVLGPFPIHAREQHILSPSFPIRLNEPVDLTRSWSSSYADGGSVSWTKAQSDKDGHLNISFPDIRWAQLRATEGWAALQHHALIRTELTVYPPTSRDASKPLPESHHNQALPQLRVNLIQGAYFTILPVDQSQSRSESEFDSDVKDESNIVPRWYSGNIYALTPTSASDPQVLPFPQVPSSSSSSLSSATSPISTLSSSKPTKYHIYIAADYEIRLFGDPTTQDPASEVPVQKLQISVDLEISSKKDDERVVLAPELDVSCDFVGGQPFGHAWGVGLRNMDVDGWWTVISVDSLLDDVDVTIKPSPGGISEPFRLAPLQTRILPLELRLSAEKSSFSGEAVPLKILVRSASSTEKWLESTLTVDHHTSLQAESLAKKGVKASYFFADSMPTLFYAIPPLLRNNQEDQHDRRFEGEDRDCNHEDGNETGSRATPPLLALHGAGVDIFGQSFWQEALPRQKHSWIVVPSGRTSWGLDWHGPSSQEAWASLDALANITHSGGSADPWKPWRLERDTPAILFGHSNGGQGAWWNAERYPDRVVAVIAAAGYLKSQSYVPWTLSRSAHFVDPALRSILDSALTPDDNDLFASNLHGKSILAIHGGSDDNVPVWHSREMVSIIKTWYPDADITLIEDKGGLHWYDGIIDRPEVQSFLGRIFATRTANGDIPRASHGQLIPESKDFTFTVAVPLESGSMYGWKVNELRVPGRLGRAHFSTQGSQSLQDVDRHLRIRTANIAQLTSTSMRNFSTLTVDGTRIPLGSIHSSGFTLTFTNNRWRLTSQELADSNSRSVHRGRLQTMLNTDGPLTLIYTTGDDYTLSIAQRIAHDLLLFHRLDTQLLTSAEALVRKQKGSFGIGNIVVIGNPSSLDIRDLMNGGRSPVTADPSNGRLTINGWSSDEPSTGLLFLHPHLTHKTGNAVFLLGTDGDALERVTRLVAPFRTGIAVPDWLMLGPAADTMGTGGVLATGLWTGDETWRWSEESSFTSWLPHIDG